MLTGDFFKNTFDARDARKKELGRCIKRILVHECIFYTFQNGHHTQREWNHIAQAIGSFGKKIGSLCVECLSQKGWSVFPDDIHPYGRWAIGDNGYHIFVYGDICVECKKTEENCVGSLAIYAVTSYTKKTNGDKKFFAERPTKDFVSRLTHDVCMCMPKDMNF